jgi:hypothetical protein
MQYQVTVHCITLAECYRVEQQLRERVLGRLALGLT